MDTLFDRSTSKPFFLQPVSSRQVKQRQRRGSSSFGLGGIGGNNRGSYQCNEVWAPVIRPNEHQLSYAIADYQVVFQQLKQEYPALASGALHQKTMARLAEIKANQVEEQRERVRKEEEERPLNIFASKLVGMIMPGDIHASSKQDPDNNNGGLRRNSPSAAWMQDPTSRGGGLRRGSTYGSRNTLGNDSMQSLWNRREPSEDFINRSNSVFSLLQKSTAPPDDQALHIRCVSLLTRRTVSTADDSSRFNSNDNLHNLARRMSKRMSENTVKEEEEEEDDLIGISRRGSDNSLMSDLSGLDYENVNATDHYSSLKSDLSGLFEVTDDEIINVDDHYDDKCLHSVRSETALTSASSQGEDGKQDKEEGKINLLQNGIDVNRSPKSNVTQFFGLDLVKSLPLKTNDESDLQCITTLSITSELTTSDCYSTTSSNLNGMIVGFSDQHTYHDGNDLLVGFVDRRRSESPY